MGSQSEGLHAKYPANAMEILKTCLKYPKACHPSLPHNAVDYQDLKQCLPAPTTAKTAIQNNNLEKKDASSTSPQPKAK